MEGGDITNVELPRLWFVFEGLIVEPLNDPPRKRFGRDATVRHRSIDAAVSNPYMRRLLLDLSWRQGLQISVVSFLFGNDREWRSLVQEWLDDRDVPAKAHAYDHVTFHRDVLLSPSCWAAYTAAPSPALPVGGKVAVLDPRSSITTMT